MNVLLLLFGASIGVTLLDFCRDLGHQKTRVPGLLCGIVCMMLCLAVSVEHRLVTERHTTMAYTALAWRRMVKSQIHIIYTQSKTNPKLLFLITVQNQLLFQLRRRMVPRNVDLEKDGENSLVGQNK